MSTKTELEAQNALLTKAVKDLRAEVIRAHRRFDAEQSHWQRVCDEHNALSHMLDDVFSLQVGAKDFDGDTPLWDVTDQASGAVLVRHERDITEAYRQAILRKQEKGS